jgi:hypothetical protein
VNRLLLLILIIGFAACSPNPHIIDSSLAGVSLNPYAAWHQRVLVGEIITEPEGDSEDFRGQLEVHGASISLEGEAKGLAFQLLMIQEGDRARFSGNWGLVLNIQGEAIIKDGELRLLFQDLNLTSYNAILKPQ